jgi:hypothetical protein
MSEIIKEDTSVKITNRTVTIKRNPITRIHPDLYIDSVVSIGAAFNIETGDLLRGLSFEEERRLLPELLGVEATDLNFRKKASEFWADISIIIPLEGKKLNVSTERLFDNVDGKKVAIEVPINLRDYVYFRYVDCHREVAKDKEDCLGNPYAKFYIEDSTAELEKATSAFAKKKEINKKVLELTDGANPDIQLLKSIVYVLKPFHRKQIPSTLEALSILLSEISEQYPSEFLVAATDKDIKDRALIATLQEKGIITMAGNMVYDEMVGDSAVADDTDSYIKYINQPKQSAYKTALIARLQAKR